MNNLKNDFSKELIDYIGPSYSYSDNITPPEKLKVSSASTVGKLFDDAMAIVKYNENLVFSPALGNNFFVKSGWCDKKKSVDECKGKDRWIYVRNIPTGKAPCTDSFGIHLPGTVFKGLIPGLVEDLVDINPITIFNSLLGTGGFSSTCTKRTLPVGPSNNLKNVTKCSPADLPATCVPKFTENFLNINDKYHYRKQFIIWTITILILIFLIYYILKLY